MDYQTRQHRPRAYNLARQAHELTFSCYHRYPFLSKERTCEWLADAIRDAKTVLDYSLWAYVFMPDHVHLIVFPNRIEYDVSEFLKLIKEPVSRRAIAFLRREAVDWLERIRVIHGRKVEHHFWQQGRSYDRNIDNAKTLQRAIEYLHLNPIRTPHQTGARLEVVNRCLVRGNGD